ncbi:protein toll-like [Mercenaria mercenaria]|uniref:protein toll-like n=1 Tax=Mercenaria mercenaria TaxID=6596 RepID=UPI00234F3A07|nr:protein toll-like [Mercenaria mercenaria]
MEVKLNIFLMAMAVILCYSAGGNRYPYLCNLFDMEDYYKQSNVSNPLDRQILIGIMDVTECWINMAELYTGFILTPKVKKLQTIKERVMISLTFSCHSSITVHFNNFSITDNYKKVDLDLELGFSKCSIIINEVNIFLKIGTILMLRNIKNVIKTESETNCLFAVNLQAIHLEANCDQNYELNCLFWESCMQIFPNMAVLTIIGCEYNYYQINTSSLREKFPNLDSLVLNFARVDHPLIFPWMKSQIIHNENIDNILKAYFDLYKDIYFYSMFPKNSILFIHCQVKFKSLVLKGEVDMLALTEMGLSYLEPSLLLNVTLTQTLNLAKNKLETIHEDLLKNQDKLLRIYLQDNKLTKISNKMFAGLKKLRYINLGNNNIRVIEDDPFKSLYHLKDILLQNNSIAQFPRDMFRDQTGSLEFLEINSNPRITDIPLWPIYSTYLYDMDIRDANITGDSIVRLLNHLNKLDVNEKLVDGGMDPPFLPLGNTGSIDLSFNKIKTIPSDNMTGSMMLKLKYLFINYNIGVDGNPFTCNCDTSVIQEVVSDKNEVVSMEDELASWLCVNPPEFRGRPMWTIAETEKYCPINAKHCPNLCSCFKRSGQETIIVDCHDVVLKHMPKQLPNFQLELWFQNSSISEIGPLPYLENVTVLNLAENKLGNIEPMVINQLRFLKVLHLHSNHLTSIPFQVTSLKLSKLTLSDNPFICDCTTGWMKQWLLDDEKLVPDWTYIKCLNNYDNLQQLIAVPDSEFVCKEDNSFSVTEHVFLPAMVIGSILFVLVVLTLIIYFQRFNLKVLLFIHFNLHPFDKQSDRKKDYVYDAVTVCSHGDIEQTVKIVNHLIEKGYKIADMYRNSYIGYTYIENVEKLINCSNKVILVLTQSAINDKIIQAAWNIAYDKAMTTSMTSLILVTDRVIKKQQKDVDINLLQFLKSNSSLDRESKFLKEKIEYLMPKIKFAENRDIEMEQRGNDLRVESNAHEDTGNRIPISYPDEYHFYVKNEIIPFLAANNICAKILDMEFTPGADIRDELPMIFDTSRHMMFIFSEESLADEVRIYILSQALTKTQLEDHNFLLLCTSGKICLEHMTNDLSKYVENYVTISVNDPKFKERILESITHNSEVKRNEQNYLENDPLLPYHR